MGYGLTDYSSSPNTARRGEEFHMSFLYGFAQHHDPAGKWITHHDPAGEALFAPKSPQPPPGVPNPNDAMNAAQAQTDALRQRRGILANIYAGASSTQPVSGKTTLG